MERQRADPLIRTKLRPPFTRLELVPRPRLVEQIAQGLRRPLTLITAPAGFGKTTLVASSIPSYGLPMAWLSLDRNDDQPGRFLEYLVAALQEVDPVVGTQAAQLMAAAQQPSPEAVLTSLINDLDASGCDMALVLDDYQFIRNQAVHEAVAFLLQHCPQTLHLVIATRSDPPLPLSRLRARAQTVELRTADLSFTKPEAASFLNDVMGLGLDARSIAALKDRTEGWIAGLQMAALSMRDREDVSDFIESFSGTHRYILDYLLEEVLASQPPDIQRFLLHTSILERLTAPLCDAVLGNDPGPAPEAGDRSAPILEYLERANLFLVPLDDERIWYRYHHLFADLLRTQLLHSVGAHGVAQLHIRAADWHAQHGSILEAIHHASAASDDDRLERFIEQHYRQLVSRGEQSRLRTWTTKLSRELVHRRPWLCIYEAYSHSWFGELDEADRLLDQAEKRVPADASSPDARAMRAHLAYVKSRITAMRGDIQRAIEFCLEARHYAPPDNVALQLDTRITLGYEYFMAGDYVNARPALKETIRSGVSAGAVINTVAASCVLARLYAVQGLLHEAYDTYQRAAQCIPGASGEHLGARALVAMGLADLFCEWNDLDAALAHTKQGLDLLPFWDKADDWALAYVTLARIHLAQANTAGAGQAIEQAVQLLQTRGVFSEARNAVETAQVKVWLAQGDLPAATRWAASQAERLRADERFRFENELAHITQARIWMAENKPRAAMTLLSQLEGTARAAGRMGRVIHILLLEALALGAMGDARGARQTLEDCLALAEPEGYVRLFLDEGQPLQMLLAQWLAHATAGPLRDYALRLLAHFDGEPYLATAAQPRVAPTGDLVKSELRPIQDVLVEPLSQRELEVVHLIALGMTNREIAQQLVIAPGTVKAHAASIYRKLDVANRTEAVARARQLGILS
jgi:LuxR family maltose regulon positive regulatory protein